MSNELITTRSAPLSTVTSAAGPQETEIDLLDLLRYYLSHALLLIVAAVVGAVGAFLYTRYLVPVKYTASSQMYMVSASSDSVLNISDLNIGTNLSNDYVVLMKSRPVMEDVIDKLDLDYTYEQLSQMVSLSVVSNTRIVRISATSTSPREAMDIANQMARTSRIELPKVMTAPSPTVAEYAVMPTQKSSPSTSRNVLMGTMLALVAVLAVLTVLYLMDDTIKTSEDVEKEFGVLPLTVIPEEVIEGLQSDEEKSGRAARKATRAARKGGHNA